MTHPHIEPLSVSKHHMYHLQNFWEGSWDIFGMSAVFLIRLGHIGYWRSFDRVCFITSGRQHKWHEDTKFRIHTRNIIIHHIVLMSVGRYHSYEVGFDFRCDIVSVALTPRNSTYVTYYCLLLVVEVYQALPLEDFMSRSLSSYPFAS